MSSRTLSQWLQRIEALHPSEIELGLERANEVYERLPNTTQPRVVTVAGTNGKGSTVECLTQCAVSLGLNVGTYTSPHLVHFNERMCLNNVPADSAQIVTAFEAVEVARGDTPLTYFEFTTLAALALFRSLELDLWVLEVGLGGRLDATNIIDADVAVVTAIGLDHQDWLGNDREVIGREKAGIMRANQVVVCSDPRPPQAIAAYAEEVGATLLQLGVDFNYADSDTTWRLDLPAQTPVLRSIEPAGQKMGQLANDLPDSVVSPASIELDKPAAAVLDNVAGALTALAVLDWLPAIDQLTGVMSNWSLRGRLQRLDLDVPWWLDVAHNAESAKLLASTLAHFIHSEQIEQCYIVLGMLGDKPADEVVLALAPVATQWLIVQLDSPRALPAQELAEKVQRVSSASVEILQSVAAGVAVAKARASTQSCVVVTGSFHTVGPALAWLAKS